MKKLITEFIGTFFLVLVVGMAAVGGLAGTMAAVAIGSILMVMVYAGGHISGAHYNPAVTLAILIRKRINFTDALSYMVAQIAGGVVAALVTYFFLGNKMPLEAASMEMPIQGLVAELLGTFALAYVVLNVATAKANAGNSFYGLAIGLTVTACAYALGGFTGGAFNPAVAVGLSVMKAASWSYIWVYAIGCFGGGLLAGLVFNLNNPEDK